MASASISRPKIRCTASAFIWTTSSALSFPEFADDVAMWDVYGTIPPCLRCPPPTQLFVKLSDASNVCQGLWSIYCWRMCHSKLCNLNKLQALPPLLLLLFVFSPRTVGLRSASDKNLKFDTYQDFPGSALSSWHRGGRIRRIAFVHLPAANYGDVTKACNKRDEVPPPVEGEFCRSIELVLVNGLQHATCYARSEPQLTQEVSKTHMKTQESAHSDRCSVFNSLEVIEFCDSDSS